MPTVSARPRTDDEIRALRHVSLAEWGEILRASKKILADSNQTRELMVIEEVLNRSRIARLLRNGYFDGDEPRDLLRDRPLVTPRTVDLAALRAKPEETLGGAFARHLERYELNLGLFDEPTPVLADHPDIGWVVQRNRQTHDLWHTLLGLGVLPHEEVLVHAFCWGHLGVPQSAFIVLFGAVKHMVLEARWRTLRIGLRAAYDAGHRAAPLWAVYWERHWDEPLAEVRRRLRVEPYASALD